jgi:nucleolar pre-ribosomal-associated protein 1
MSVIYRYLNSGTHVVISCTLRLLVIEISMQVSMVMHGPTTTKELEQIFNFSLKSVPSFLEIRKRQKPTLSLNENLEPSKCSLLRSDDIRTLYIKFLLGFFIRGDASVKKALLDSKCISYILKNIRQDSFQLIEFILNTLRTSLVDDIYLARSPKVAFFKPFIFEQICKLYSLNIQKDLSISGIQISVAEMVHDFFQYICLKPGTGVCFADNGYYPAVFKYENLTDDLKYRSGNTKVFNVALLSFLKTLNISTDMKQRELFLQIITNSHELVHAYYFVNFRFWSSDPNLSFEPRSSVHYLGNISLVTSIINSDIPNNFGSKEKDLVQLPPPVKNCMSNILPAAISKSLNSKALMLKSKDLRYATSQLLNASFRKLTKMIDSADLITNSIKQSSLRGSDNAIQLWKDWKESLFIEYRKQLPDSQIVIALFSKLDQNEPEDEIDQEEYHSSILELLGNYHKTNIENLLETRFDIGRVIPIDFQTSFKVQNQIICLLACVTDFKWYAKNGKSSLSYFGMVVKLGLESDDCKFERKVIEIFKNCLSNSFLFQDSQESIHILWLQLKSIPRCHLVSMLEWVDYCYINDNKFPFKLVERVMHLKDLEGGSSVLMQNPYSFPPLVVSLADAVCQNNAPEFGIMFLMRLISVVIPSTSRESLFELQDMLIKIDDIKLQPLINLNDVMLGRDNSLTLLSWKKSMLYFNYS